MRPHKLLSRPSPGDFHPVKITVKADACVSRPKWFTYPPLWINLNYYRISSKPTEAVCPSDEARGVTGGAPARGNQFPELLFQLQSQGRWLLLGGSALPGRGSAAKQLVSNWIISYYAPKRTRRAALPGIFRLSITLIKYITIFSGHRLGNIVQGQVRPEPGMEPT